MMGGFKSNLEVTPSSILAQSCHSCRHLRNHSQLQSLVEPFVRQFVIFWIIHEEMLLNIRFKSSGELFGLCEVLLCEGPKP